jgi:UDPglucose 6-dehydrogenase
MKIAVFGAGYVGLSLSVLFARNRKLSVDLYDVNKDVIKSLGDNRPHIHDEDILHSFQNESLNLNVKHLDNLNDIYNFYIISTPTNYDEANDFFDTSSVETSITKILKSNRDAQIIIKSTIPVGFTDQMCSKFGTENIYFSPEFLREGSALHDNFFPSRIIIGTESVQGRVFADLLITSSKKEQIDTLFMTSKQAESVKLFSNTYLAMRVAFFNELHTYSSINNMSTKAVIEGVCLDSRIGNDYNNPSFGYGGYCLPKDVKQLTSELRNTNAPLIKNINNSNEARKDYIAKEILRRISDKNNIGIYLLSMKKGSDNYRSSSIIGVMERLKKKNINIIIHDPHVNKSDFKEYLLENDLMQFKKSCDLIVTNRIDEGLNDSLNKVYTTDIFYNN